jgi:hypothetical protein
MLYQHTAEYINDHMLPKFMWWKPPDADKLELSIKGFYSAGLSWDGRDFVIWDCIKCLSPLDLVGMSIFKTLCRLKSEFYMLYSSALTFVC